MDNNKGWKAAQECYPIRPYDKIRRDEWRSVRGALFGFPGDMTYEWIPVLCRRWVSTTAMSSAIKQTNLGVSTTTNTSDAIEQFTTTNKQR